MEKQKSKASPYIQAYTVFADDSQIFMPIPDHSSKLQSYLPNKHFKVSCPKQKSSSFCINPLQATPAPFVYSTAKVTTIHPAAQTRNLDVFKDSSFSFTPPFQNHTPSALGETLFSFLRSSGFLCTICTPLKSRIPLDSQPTQGHKEGQKGKGQTLPFL